MKANFRICRKESRVLGNWPAIYGEAGIRRPRRYFNMVGGNGAEFKMLNPVKLNNRT
ncbi:MAG: hypothetical protein MUO26_13590 [Methanotrichaceae archaeon]|nr:hypothetical protein [Methanotrichaceae archaeon]